jgi:hypothetical protein
MNQNSLKAAVKKYGDIKEISALQETLSKDEKNYTALEIEEICNAIENGMKSEVKSDVKTHNDPNKDLDLSFYEYDGLKANVVKEDGEDVNVPSEAFVKYQELESKLLDRKSYMFCKFNAKPNVEVVFSKRTGDKNTRLVGIELVNSKPLFETLLEWRHAKDLNAQIMDLNNRSQNSIYFILKNK